MSRTSSLWAPARPRRPAISLHAIRRGLTRMRVSFAAGVRADEPVAVALTALLILSVYFALLPGVDLAVSALFRGAGGGFPLSTEPLLIGLRKSSTYGLGLLIIGLAGEALIGLARDRGRLKGYARRAVFLLMGLALASGLVVNGVLKSLWGRARPVQVDVFGGDAAFSPAWRISDGCAHNCSFVSGEASSAAWMVAVIVVMCPPDWRRWALPAVLAYALALSLNRLAFGGHFLSDIVLSWAITALTLAVLHRLMLTCPQQARRRRRRRQRMGLSPVA